MCHVIVRACTAQIPNDTKTKRKAALVCPCFVRRSQSAALRLSMTLEQCACLCALVPRTYGHTSQHGHSRGIAVCREAQLTTHVYIECAMSASTCRVHKLLVRAMHAQRSLPVSSTRLRSQTHNRPKTRITQRCLHARVVRIQRCKFCETRQVLCRSRACADILRLPHR